METYSNPNNRESEGIVTIIIVGNLNPSLSIDLKILEILEFKSKSKDPCWILDPFV